MRNDGDTLLVGAEGGEKQLDDKERGLRTIVLMVIIIMVRFKMRIFPVLLMP